MSDPIEITKTLAGGTRSNPRTIAYGREWISNGHWAVRKDRVSNLTEIREWLNRGRTPWGADIYTDERGDTAYLERIFAGESLGAVVPTGWSLRIGNSEARVDGNWRSTEPMSYTHLRGREAGSFLVPTKYARAFQVQRWTVMIASGGAWYQRQTTLVDYVKSASVFVLPVVTSLAGSSESHRQAPPFPAPRDIGPQPSIFGGRRAIDLRKEER